ncbi:phytoene desaturase [Paenibacillus barcinonensis]|uniref:Phytoene desaturase n=1 Tax=Paenibacillus barcinonensis TaxID=198119 RepID=A0A2V4VD61_PAEBA|nr:phytoene desaturase family protein [Paenibacillus barcinonensis]PYE50719.1 phytoene desaturase [Paenibacillus barcinonensis]QKS57403.1 phytoene desaturase [Paenibacillus barcinonensis]
MKRAAVIGAGIGGLTSALLLNRQGWDVTVYERGSRVGGRIAFEQEGDYRIDQGPTIVLLPEMLLGILEEAGVERSKVELLRCDPLYRVHYDSGRVMTKMTDRHEQTAEIERLFPGEGRGFTRFMKDMDTLFPAGRAAFLEQMFPRKRDFFTPSLMALMGRLRAHKSVRKAVGDYFEHEELLDAYSLQSLYIGGSPFGTPGIYSLLPYAEHEYGIWMVRGGYAALPEILEQELLARGGKIKLQTEVTGLTIRNGVCTGIETAEGAENVDAVVYNGDFPHLNGLLKQTPEVTVRRKPYRPSSGCVLIYAGVDKRWDDAVTHQFFLPPSLDGSLKEVFQKRRIPARPSFYVFNPAAVDDTAAPSGQSVLYFLIPVPDAEGVNWEEESEALAERVLEEAEQRGFPGLRAALRWKKLRTPADAARDGLYGGGSFGIAPVLFQSGVYRPQPKPFPKIKGLYAAGASVHPGGGVPIVMQGARMAVNQLMKEMGT